LSPSDDAIARDAERLVDEWREACRIPSVTGDREAVEEMAAWVEERVGRRFDRVVVDRTTQGVPVVLAELTSEGPGRLVIYTHYDVQPAGDPAAWDSDPFAAELRDGVVYARGTCDDKADITARLQAIDYWLDAHDGRPIGHPRIMASRTARSVTAPAGRPAAWSGSAGRVVHAVRA